MTIHLCGVPGPSAGRVNGTCFALHRTGFGEAPCHHGAGGLLPHPFTLTPLGQRLSGAVCFLWRYPWGRPRRMLSVTVFPWSPDFPPALLAKDQRPSGHLTRPLYRSFRRKARMARGSARRLHRKGRRRTFHDAFARHARIFGQIISDRRGACAG